MRRELLLPLFSKTIATHGGEAAKGRRKVARPIALKRPMHLCMRSESARGDRSMRRGKHLRCVAAIVQEEAKRHDVRIQSWANVGNHLHFMLRVYRRIHFQNFLRAIAGRIALAVTGARKGRPLAKRFWEHLAYSRALTSQREEEILLDYVRANILEAKFPHYRDIFLHEQAELRRARRRP